MAGHTNQELMYNRIMKMCLYYLTCKDEAEAQLVSDTLLDKKLVACVKTTFVSSAFLWEGKKDAANEVLLIIDSIEENFDLIDSELKMIHSYETYNLAALPIVKTTPKVENWLKENLC